MSEHKTPVDQALDLLVYAPIGLALTAAEELPRLVERGRQTVTAQTGMYRMLGQFAVSQGQQMAGRLVRDAAQRVGGRGASRPTPPRPPAPAASTPAAAGTTTPRPAPTPRATVTTATVATAGGPRPSTNGGRPVPASDSLAIPGYDALSASQVVQRLAGLAGDELEAVRTYEAATRGRKTILSRIAQLQSGA